MVALIGVLTTVEYVFHANLHIDQVLARDTPHTIPTLFPGRMSPATAGCFFLLGMALLALRRAPFSRWVSWLTLPALTISSIALVGHLYGVASLYRVGLYSSMALHTAIAFCVLSLAILLAEPNDGFVRALSSRGSGGWMARRLLPMLPVVMVLLGWLWQRGATDGYYDATFGLALMVVARIVLLCALVAWVSVLLDKAETRRLEAENENEVLRASLAQKKFEALLESAPDAMVIVNETGRIALVNTRTEQLFGYSRQELLGQPVEVLVPDDLGLKHQEYPSMLAGAPHIRTMGAGFELRGLRRDGTQFPIDISLGPLDTEDGLLFSTAIRDVTERKQAEASASHLAAIVGSASHAIVTADTEGIIRSWNHGAEQLFGQRAEEMIHQSELRFIPEERHRETQENWPRILRGEAIAQLETLRLQRDGSIVDVEVSISPLRDKRGQIVGASKIYQSITARKKAQDALRSSLEEKETMLREIHHRVKNNLAVISSLLYLESTYQKDEPTVALFQEARDRVLSMAKVHESLYHSNNLAALNFGLYVKDVLHHLAQVYQLPARRVSFRTGLDEIMLSVEVAIPCGLILTELITNAMKHAFPGDTEGEIHVCLQRRDEVSCSLRVSDSGIGIPVDLDAGKARSLGLRLIRSLTLQLQGEFRIVRADPGTEAELCFPLDQNQTQSENS